MKKQFIAGLLIALAPVLLHASALTTNLLTNPGAETGDLSGWTPGGPGSPTVDSGSFDHGINPHTGAFDFLGFNGASDSLSQTFSIVVQGVTTALIDSGTLLADASFWEQGLNQGDPSDNAYVQLAFLDGSMNILGSVSTPNIDSHNGQWENYANGYAIPIGTRYMTYSMQFVRNVGSDLDAFVDDNSLVIDSNVPEPGALLTFGSGILAVAGVVRRTLSR